MEEPDKSKRFRFPGYNGSLPKAMRSTRGRCIYQKKLNQASDDLQCIELLATVAGQVLESKAVQESTQNAFANEIGKENKEIGRCQADLHSFQVLDFGEYPCPSHMLGMIDKDSGKVMSQDASKGVYLQNGENTIGVDAGSCNKEGGSRFGGSLIPKEDGLNHAMPLELPELGYSTIHIYSEGHAESDANCSIVRDRDAREEGISMTLLQDSSSLHVSPRSNEEALTHVHKQLFDQCSGQPLEVHMDYSQDFVRLKARDDDDNFLNSVVPGTTLGHRSSAPILSSDSQIHGSQCKSSGEAVSIAATKGEGLFTDGAGKGSEKHITSELQGTKRRHVSASFKPSCDQNKSSSLQPLDLDAKDASVASSPTTTSKGSWKSAKGKLKETRDSSSVKVNITSFRVPELSINLPETATVANLKRAVMEAAVDLLGGGLHVRVLHHGQKVYDENSTLVQMGISCKERLESLAFMLEPNGMSDTCVSIGESVFTYSKARSQPAARYPVFNLSDDMDGSKRMSVNAALGVHVEMDTSNNSEMQEKNEITNQKGPELQQSLPCEVSQPTEAALILHPGVGDNTPADLVTAQQAQQDLRSQGGRRRIRRPFTIVEVEALVQAVELLGTGRWREVKQQVFNHAWHRTYVDLKDKWKTLVHTAHIAPQQRRGEPVPQELLDRVLHAHTYWAIQLAKQQEDLCV